MKFFQNDKLFKGVQVLLFSFLFIYILLRIIFVETLHDEVATYMFYFYQGDFWGDTIQWDANNHLLNSLIGHIIYKLFGDNFVLLRMPNLIAFVLYFWGMVKLLDNLNAKSLQWFGLIGIVTIPFILEYFGNARGYGLSMGFFVWGLYFAVRYLKDHRLTSLIFTCIFLVLAVSANLTLIVASGFIALFLFIAPFITKNPRQFVKEIIVYALFGLALVPFFLFGLELKKAGALYYGSLDGLWDVTGKTLSRYVIFYDSDWLMYMFIALFTFIIIGLFILRKKQSLKEYWGNPLPLYVLLFFGNLLTIYITAVILDVNYPEDRTAMYLIPLFLMILLHLLDHFYSLRPAQWLFLFFPLTLISHISLETSVFSPDDRLNNEFYAKVKHEISSQNTLMIYHIMNWNWPYHESHAKEKASVAQFDNPNSSIVDILITKTTILNNPDVLRLYDTIAYHPPSTYIAFKRKKPLNRVFIDSTTSIHEKGNLEFVNLGSFSLNGLSHKNVVVSIQGHLKTVAPYNKIQLIVRTTTNNGEEGRYLYYSFETTYQSQLIDDDFIHHFVLEDLKKEETEIKVYLWNRALHLIEVKDSYCKLYELKATENGIR